MNSQQIHDLCARNQDAAWNNAHKVAKLRFMLDNDLAEEDAAKAADECLFSILLNQNSD